MAYSQTRDSALLERFSAVYNYTFSHVSHLQWHLIHNMNRLVNKTGACIFMYDDIFDFMETDLVHAIESVRWFTFVVDFIQFSDPENGEWFGYLTQEGKVALDFKGGPFKGKKSN